MQHLTNWIEIPVLKMDRAIAFYKKILNTEFTNTQIGDFQYALFPSDDRFNCGALVQGESYKPSSGGVLIYLNGGDDLNTILQKVSSAGGEVIMAKTFLSKEAGYIGFFSDTEGNRIGLQNI